jgi:hypothetical protein
MLLIKKTMAADSIVTPASRTSVGLAIAVSAAAPANCRRFVAIFLAGGGRSALGRVLLFDWAGLRFLELE